MEYMQTGVLSLDWALRGGWPQGAVSEILGSGGSGRSTLALHAIAECQRRADNVAVLLKLTTAVRRPTDFDAEYVRRLGVDERRLLVIGARDSASLGKQLRSFTTHDRVHSPNLVVIDIGDHNCNDAGLCSEIALQLRHFCARRRHSTLLFVTNGAILPLRTYAATRIELSTDGEAVCGDQLVTAKVLKHRRNDCSAECSLQFTLGDGVDRIKDLIRVAAFAGMLESGDVASACEKLSHDVAARENLTHAVRRKLFLGSLSS